LTAVHENGRSSFAAFAEELPSENVKNDYFDEGEIVVYREEDETGDDIILKL
jgi:hypothetical protein